LYCDARLPLYRKITDGQFCSSAHRKAYWHDQERMAVERLHQTHRTLRAIQVPEPEPAEPPRLGDPAPPVAGWLSMTLPPAVAKGSQIVAADPLEYESTADMTRPGLLLASPAELQGVAPQVSLELRPAAWTSVVSCAVQDELAFNPAHTHSLGSAWQACALAAEGYVSMPAVQSNDWKATGASIEIAPIAAAPQVSLLIPFDVRPQTDVFERVADEQAAFCDRTLPINIQPRNYTSRLAFDAAVIAPAPSTCIPQAIGAQNDVEDFPTADLQPLQLADARCPDYFRAEFVSAEPVFAAGSDPSKPARVPSLGALDPAVAGPVEWREVLPAVDARIACTELEPVAAQQSLALPAVSEMSVESAPLPASERMVGLTLEFVAADFVSQAAPMLAPQASTLAPAIPASRLKLAGLKKKEWQDTNTHPSVFTVGGVVNFWKSAPRDLRVLAVAIPLLIALAFHPSLPTVRLSAQTQKDSGIGSTISTAISKQWVAVKHNIASRAGLELSEDFRNGLDNWESRGDLTTAWSYDATGFVKPGVLATFKPSADLADYRLDFLGQIEKKAISWVARAKDLDNYYAMKLVVVKGGPLPTIGLVRYAVVDGKAEKPVETVLTVNARPDTLYRVSLEVRGDDFALMVQGRMAASWTEKRLKRGGVGFFSTKGEQSRLRWMLVTHQYDVLGRLCAYLAPYNLQTANGSIKQ
jgi:hypothetical protein